MATSEGLPLLQRPASPHTKTHQASKHRQHQRKRRIIIGAALVTMILTVAALFATYRGTLAPWGPSPTVLASAEPFANVVDIYRATHDFDGVVQVRINGSVVYELASGAADEEFDVPMTQESIFPVGSNSKLFVSVMLYQLQERGLVNLSQPVNQYLDQHDFTNFGFPNQTHWCPRVRGASPDSPCENITFVQLMHMGSGMGDSIGCDNVDAAHCYNTAENLAYFRGSLGAHVGVYINDPLVFKPDTNYSYSNPNYILLSYMVEKISGVPLEKYLQTEIADKIGLKHTYFDPYSGGLGIRKGYVQQYIHYYAQPSSDVKGARLATGTCSPYTNSGAAAGSGGFRSTISDMQRWYLDLFDRRGTASKVLSAESIQMIVERTNPFEPAYAQGIAVLSLRQDGWPSELAYCGGMKCCVTCLAMLFPENRSDASVVVGAFSNHFHFGFAHRAAFDAFRPTGFNILPPADATNADDGGASFLYSALAKAYNDLA